MSDEVTSTMIGRLVDDLRPVRRLARPGWRASWWLGGVALCAILLASTANLAGVAARLGARPDMWLSVVGSTATAVAAVVAALMLALPDRDGRWAWLPVPPALLWLAASGMGCLRTDAVGLLHPASMTQATSECLPFILEFSALFAVPLGLLLWWAKPLRIGLVAWMGGLAVASASASLLWLVHPFDAGLADLIVHAAAIGAVMLTCRVASFLLPE